MNSFVLWFIIWHFGTSFQQMMIMKPIETSESNILRTIKIQTIAACWVECQNNNENKSESTENKSLKTTEICQFTVGYYEFVYSIICRT